MSENSQGGDGGAEDGDGLVENLFGERVTPHIERRGRPKLRVSDELRTRVAKLAASRRLTRAQIATAVGCSEPTLREYFFRELEEGGADKLARAIERLYDLGMEGNVTALSKFIGLALKAEEQEHGKRRGPALRMLGKKEQLHIDAQTPPDDWSDVLPQRPN